MSAKSKTATKTRDPAMGIFVDYMRSRGPTPVLQVVKEVTQVDEPRTGQLDACLKFMREDDRFSVTGEGFEAVCVLVDAERAEMPESAGPEELTVDGQIAVESSTAGTGAGTQESGQTVPPAMTAPADPTPTIGEQLAASEAAKAAEATTSAAQPHSDAAEPPTDHETELETRIQALRALAEELGTFEDEYSRLTKARGEAKKAVDTTRAKMIEVINGKSMDEVEDLPVFKMAKETKPAKSETLQAISETKEPKSETNAAKVETPTGLSFFDMGVESAYDNAGCEYNCPISREQDARGVGYWFAGVRAELARSQELRPAIKQGLTRDQLMKAALPCNGLLPKGEDQPKVAIVKFDERAHLVLDMTIIEDPEQTTSQCEEWQLQPLFDRDEWATLWQDKYGYPVKGSHENPEKEETRLKGGVDCARLVKAGRNIFVVGPREMVVHVSCPKAEG